MDHLQNIGVRKGWPIILDFQNLPTRLFKIAEDIQKIRQNPRGNFFWNRLTDLAKKYTDEGVGGMSAMEFGFQVLGEWRQFEFMG